MTGIKQFYFVDKNDLKQNRDLLQKRFSRSKVVKETRKMHAFITVKDNVHVILVKSRSSTNRFERKTVLGKVNNT